MKISYGCRTNWQARKTASPSNASDTTTRSRTTTRTSDSSRTMFLRAGQDSSATMPRSLLQRPRARLRRSNFQRRIAESGFGFVARDYAATEFGTVIAGRFMFWKLVRLAIVYRETVPKDPDVVSM